MIQEHSPPPGFSPPLTPGAHLPLQTASGAPSVQKLTRVGHCSGKALGREMVTHPSLKISLLLTLLFSTEMDPQSFLTCD